MIYICFRLWSGVCTLRSYGHISWISRVAMDVSFPYKHSVLTGLLTERMLLFLLITLEAEGKNPTLFYAGATIAYYPLDFFHVASAHGGWAMIS